MNDNIEKRARVKLLILNCALTGDKIYLSPMQDRWIMMADKGEAKQQGNQIIPKSAIAAVRRRPHDPGKMFLHAIGYGEALDRIDKDFIA